jgi:hypothetical protein
MQVERKTRKRAAHRTRDRRFGRGAMIAALAGTLVMPATTVQAVPCATAGAAQPTQADISIEVRRLQTNLMVAALTCSAREDYNEFVVTHRSSLQKYGKTIRAEFRRRYGKEGDSKLNQFVTRLANEASARSNADRENFCAEATTAFHQAKAQDISLTRMVMVPVSSSEVASAACETPADVGFRSVSSDAATQRR